MCQAVSDTSQLQAQPTGSPKGEHYYCSRFLFIYFIFMYKCVSVDNVKVRGQLLRLSVLLKSFQPLTVSPLLQMALSKQGTVRSLFQVTQSVAQRVPLQHATLIPLTSLLQAGVAVETSEEAQSPGWGPARGKRWIHHCVRRFVCEVHHCFFIFLTEEDGPIRGWQHFLTTQHSFTLIERTDFGALCLHEKGYWSNIITTLLRIESSDVQLGVVPRCWSRKPGKVVCLGQ